MLIALLLFSDVRLAQAVDTLPTQISDKDFWEFIQRASEADGSYPLTENFVSNEIRFQEIIPALTARIKPGSVYIGVGPEQNFTYVSALRPKMAFIVDIRRQNMIELLMYKALFELSPNRAEFLSRLFSRQRGDGLNERSSASVLFQAYQSSAAEPGLVTKNLADIKSVLNKHGFGLTADDQTKLERVFKAFADYGPAITFDARSGGGGAAQPGRFPTYTALMTATIPDGASYAYLANEDSYSWLRDFQLRNLLIPVVGDFAGPEALSGIGAYLRDHNAIVGAFYTSNVEQYLPVPTKEQVFIDNVLAMPLDDECVSARQRKPRSGTAPGSPDRFRSSGDRANPGSC